jgi:outer membrane protein OmpA-like peptidoglycan-associated protein
VVIPPSGAFRFAFTYEKGDMFRILSKVQEEVYVDRRFLNRSDIANRIAFEVTDAAPDGSWGLLHGTFDTEETLAGSTVALVQESYESEFRRDALGQYTIDPRYYMPVVRNVPVFPDRELKPGDTWTAPGEERHDLRRVFGIPDPYAIPFECRYRYEGPVTKAGKTLLLVTASYTIFYQPGPPRSWTSAYPVQVAGFSDQKIYWDPTLGQAAAYEERFKLIFDWSDGRSIEYRGTASADIVEAKVMDRAAVQADVKAAVAGLPDVKVSQDELGVTISLENIQFQADSALLLPGEAAKIAKIAAVLARYPDRDILVAGHTALAGTAEGRLKLSQERALAVARALIAAGNLDPARVRTIGWGADKPVADNATPDGMARNRRVEITILEN